MKQRLQTLIIEDEKDHFHHLEKIVLQNHPEINILGWCRSGSDAISTLQTVKPDLLLLDIDLGDMNAFDLLNYLPAFDFQIVFITNYNEYALQAFKVHAVDYLLKPVDPNELSHALQKAMLQRSNYSDYQLLVNDYHRLSREYLAINEKQKVVYIPMKEILYLEADNNYTTIHYLSDGKRLTHLSSSSLATYETKLAPEGFLRIHAKYLVSPAQIRVFNKKDNLLELACSDKLPVARSRRTLFI
ncbi:MAG: LytTR family DNA-binding domain-containing protein [Bacteroidales bacterium]|nr:LytTR family DNA-binding domain-containing protein [Bacteroidales bacterium]